MTKTIQKYLKKGVLNYVDHETPRHYFLYDGVMEENNSDVYRLVEDLCDENMDLQRTVNNLRKALDIYKRERDRYKHSDPEITGAYFLAGGYGQTDDNQLPEYVEIVPAYGCGWSRIYQRSERTINYEGS